MLPDHLTAQQRAQRCRCGHHLAWQVLGAGTQDARYAEPVCCRCWRSPDARPCTPTDQPAEGRLAVEFSEVAEPDDETPNASSAVVRAATIVYADGACSVNPGPGGWAWAVPQGRYVSGAAAQTTNQRMELTAVLEAVRALDGPLEVVSDSAYVIGCFRDRWWEGWLQNNWRNRQRKPVANRDLWEPLVELVRHRAISFRWVQGHSGDPMNELVDQLAVRACRTQQGQQGDFRTWGSPRPTPSGDGRRCLPASGTPAARAAERRRYRVRLRRHDLQHSKTFRARFARLSSRANKATKITVACTSVGTATITVAIVGGSQLGTAISARLSSSRQR